MNRREVIEPVKVSIEDQIGEAIGIVAEFQFYKEWRTRGQLDGMTREVERIHMQRRLAILATLQWLRENREAVLRVHQMLRSPEANPQDLLTHPDDDIIEDD